MQIPKVSWERAIDVSQFNNGGHPIDWNTVVPHLEQLGYSRVLMRATYGPGYEDPQFVHNWSQLKSLGFSKGAYHAALPGISGNVDADAQHQAAFFLSVINREGGIDGNDWPILDLEESNGLTKVQLALWASHWMASINAAVKNPKNPALFYSYGAFIQDRLTLYDLLAQYPLWLADYPGGTTLPKQAPPNVGAWTRYFGWQYTDGLTIPDIAGPVDGSVFAITPNPQDNGGTGRGKGLGPEKKGVCAKHELFHHC